MRCPIRLFGGDCTKLKRSIDLVAAKRMISFLQSDEPISFTGKETLLMSDQIMRSVCCYMPEEETEQLLALTHCLMAYAAQDGFTEGLTSGTRPLHKLLGGLPSKGGENVGNNGHSG